MNPVTGEWMEAYGAVREEIGGEDVWVWYDGGEPVLSIGDGPAPWSAVIGGWDDAMSVAWPHDVTDQDTVHGLLQALGVG